MKYEEREGDVLYTTDAYGGIVCISTKDCYPIFEMGKQHPVGYFDLWGGYHPVGSAPLRYEDALVDYGNI